MNQLLSLVKDDVTLIEMCFPKVIETLNIIQTDLKKHKFKWLNLEIKLIENLTDFLNSLINPLDPELDSSLLFFLDTKTLENLFPLSFIDEITKYPDNNYGKPIYEKTLDFFTSLLNFFINFYLKKDFFFLEHLDIEEIDTMTPYARQRIREKNQSNRVILYKYFKEFDLTNFVVNILNRFIIGLNQRWITSTQKAHLNGIRMSKMLIEYSLLPETECEKVKNVLYHKVQNLKLLEEIIDKEPENFPVEGIIQDFVKIREYYGEFLLSAAYLQQDNQLIEFFQTIYNKVDKKIIKKKNIFTNFEEPEKYESYLPFNENFFFEREYSRKAIEMFGYVVSQQKIKGKSLISKSAETIARNFMYLFSNNNDPYTKSLKLINDDQYRQFFSMKQSLTKVDHFFEDFLSEFNELIKKDMRKYIFREHLILKDIEDLLLNLMKEIGIHEMSLLHDEMYLDKINLNMQYMMCETNFGFIIQNLLSIYIEDIKRDHRETLLNILLFLLQYYLMNNCDNQSIFFLEKSLGKEISQMIKVFPHQTILFLYNISINFPKMIVTKSYTLEIFLNFHQILFKKYYLNKEKHDSEGFATLKRLLKIIALHLRKEYLKIFVETPANDIVIAESFIKLKEILNFEEIKTVILDYKQHSDKQSVMERYDYTMDFLLFLSDVLQMRYTNKVYLSLVELFSLKNLRAFIELVPYNLRMRSIMIEYFDTLHVDIKDHLIDEREKYYREKPILNTYDEDVVINIDTYRMVISFIMEEIDFLTTEYSKFENDPIDKKFFYDYVHNGVLGVLAKLSNFCLTLTDANLYHFISKFIY